MSQIQQMLERPFQSVRSWSTLHGAVERATFHAPPDRLLLKALLSIRNPFFLELFSFFIWRLESAINPGSILHVALGPD